MDRDSNYLTRMKHWSPNEPELSNDEIENESFDMLVVGYLFYSNDLHEQVHLLVLLHQQNEPIDYSRMYWDSLLMQAYKDKWGYHRD
jgi:hypothetical protein